MNDTTRTSTASRPAADHLRHDAYAERYAKKHIENLRHAFELVKDPADWKAPIDRTVSLLTVGLWLPIGGPDAEPIGKRAEALVKEAVIHFTGTVPAITRRADDQIHVKAWGYRLGPCGDR